jgi:hypothetical protein
MRGGAQAHLIETNVGTFYVVKLLNNPQHSRILINEWVAHALLRRVGLAVPESARVMLSDSFLEANPSLSVSLRNRVDRPASGYHWGSRYPGSPLSVSPRDSIPDSHFRFVVNRADFVGALVCDQWMANADARQAVFIPADRAHVGRLVSLFIDNGHVFTGADWVLRTSPLHGLYRQPIVYEEVMGWNDFEPWIEAITAIESSTIHSAFESIPCEWRRRSDESALKLLCSQLDRRRSRLAHLIEDLRDSLPSLFPRWTRLGRRGRIRPKAALT